MELKLAQIEKLKEIAGQQIPEQDYQQQIDRWNEYQTILDEIENMIKDKKLDAAGVQLRKNIDTSLRREEMEREAARFRALFTIPVPTYFQARAEARRGLFGKKSRSVVTENAVQNAVQKQEEPKESADITFTCKPAIHIDEFQYMNRYIKNIPQINKDPIINLPHIEMTIPKAWIAQNSLLDVMNELNNPNISQDLIDMAKKRENTRVSGIGRGIFT